jgi:hypothetical protein
MASLNDTLTLGLILILLFGAASLYLYTRIQQCEQKLNLVESILLDIKMSAELSGYPEPPPRAPLPFPPVPPNSKVAPFEELEEQERQEQERQEQKQSQETTIDESPASAIDTMAPLEEVEEFSAVPESVPTAPKVAANYESMTLAELKALAKQRSITGASSMKRSQLLEVLKPKAAPADGGILSALAEQGSPVDLN